MIIEGEMTIFAHWLRRRGARRVTSLVEPPGSSAAASVSDESFLLVGHPRDGPEGGTCQ